MSGQSDYRDLVELAQRGRWLVISTVAGSGAGHVGGPFSAMDLMVALYFRIMKVRPGEPHWPERDRFILSKGHSAIGQYTVMALRGFLPIDELKTFDKGRSRLQGHPDVTKLPGLETSTGSLGQGLSVGLGFALGGRLRGQKFEILSEHLPKRVVRFGIEDRWGESAPNDFLLDQFELSGARLSEKIAKRLKRAQP